MSNVKTTVISKELNKEIIKIRKDDESIIIYSFSKTCSVIMREFKNEPEILATISRDFLLTIMNSEQQQENIFNLCDGIKGNFISNNTNMYYTSKVVLQTIANKEMGVYYTAESVKYNIATNSYDLYCRYLKAPISITSFVINELIEHEESKGFGVYVDCINYTLDKSNDKILINIKNSNDNTVNNINIAEVYSNLKALANFYLLKLDINNDYNTITHACIKDGTFIIYFINKSKKFQLHIKMDIAIDVFTGNTPITNAELHSDKIDIPCIIEHDSYTHDSITISSLCGEIDTQIKADCNINKIFKLALLKALEGGAKN